MAKRLTPSSGITAPLGFTAAAGTCGIKPSGMPDLTLIVADIPCSAAGALTSNKVPGAPVIVTRRHLRRGQARAIVCNSGVSNVATGQEGLDNAQQMCRLVAEQIGAKPQDVLVSSTGVIGHQLPMDKVSRGIAAVAPRLARGKAADNAAARGIMTTDLVRKVAHRSLEIGGKTVQIAGIAKGSGMIAPNMATMLAFLTTDAAIAADMLRQAIQQAVRRSFNRISVDHDTSTSDMALILASGLAGHPRIHAPGPAYESFTAALTDLCQDLAYQVVKDGEGATKVFRVHVINARSERDADAVGRSIVGSPLVKTAVHGGDPNWGRLLMAVGKSEAKVQPQRLGLAVGDLPIFQAGQPVVLGKVEQRKLLQLMRRKEITFTVDLGTGKAEAQWLGCDLSRQYIAINADYTT
jgi:glutamate N-acetyltransferase / amino-acid N-acetyltransferase